MDFILTVCDDAAGEVCPIWPGHHVTSHWGVEDPSKYKEDPVKARRVVRDVAQQLTRRLRLFTALPLDQLDGQSLHSQLAQIGRAS